MYMSLLLRARRGEDIRLLLKFGVLLAPGLKFNSFTLIGRLGNIGQSTQNQMELQSEDKQNF